MSQEAAKTSSSEEPQHSDSAAASGDAGMSTESDIPTPKDEMHAVGENGVATSEPRETPNGTDDGDLPSMPPSTMDNNSDILTGFRQVFKIGSKAPTIKDPPTQFFQKAIRPDAERLDLLLKLQSANAGRLRFEVNWVVQRMNWLLLSQTFLILSYVTAMLDCGSCDGACKILQPFRRMLRILAIIHLVVMMLSIAAAASVVAELSIIQSKYDELLADSIQRVGNTSDVLWLTLNQGKRTGTGAYEKSIVGWMFRRSCFIGDKHAKWIVLASLVGAWAWMVSYEKDVDAKLKQCDM